MSDRVIMAAVDLLDTDCHGAVDRILSDSMNEANMRDAQLCVLYVLKPALEYLNGSFHDVTTFMAISDQNGKSDHIKHSMKQLVEFAGGYGVSSECCYIREGNPCHEIQKLASELDAELIVMGTHGTTGLKRLLVGSTAAAVLNGLETDIQIVKM